MFCALTLEPRSGATCSFIVGIVVKHKIIYDLTIYDFLIVSTVTLTSHLTCVAHAINK